MLDIVLGVCQATVKLLHEMSPYLLLGLFFGGLLHLFSSAEWIANHLGKRSSTAVVKAVFFGIPLPLCSCSVIPAAISLKKKGASPGAVVSFLVATPITGVDSIFATYSLLGLPFTLFRLVASAVVALSAGFLTNIFGRELSSAVVEDKTCCKANNKKPTRSMPSEIFHYAFVQLYGDIWRSLFVGLLIGGLITYFVPESLVSDYLSKGPQAMLFMLLIGLPMYVCSTGSIPIAASLMLKGISPGAALVFLLVGPATNAVTITVMGRELGKQITYIYVGTILVSSLIAGYLLDMLFKSMQLPTISNHTAMNMEAGWFSLACSALLVGLALWHLFRGPRAALTK